MDRTIVLETDQMRVIAMDSISYMQPEDNGAVIVAASNGGAATGEHAARFSGLVYFFNDAGFGKDNAGVEALSFLEKAAIAAGTVSHDSARISDGIDCYESGLLSAVNDRAAALGFRRGDRLIEAISAFVGMPRDQ